MDPFGARLTIPLSMQQSAEIRVGSAPRSLTLPLSEALSETSSTAHSPTKFPTKTGIVDGDAKQLSRFCTARPKLWIASSWNSALLPAACRQVQFLYFQFFY
jgi:hypothetical protein